MRSYLLGSRNTLHTHSWQENDNSREKPLSTTHHEVATGLDITEQRSPTPPSCQAG